MKYAKLILHFEIIILFSVLLLIHCNYNKEPFVNSNDLLLLAIISQKNKDPNDCKTYYNSLNSLYKDYYNVEFVNYSNSCETVIIGDSTMDLARTTSFYDTSKTHNYAVSGNTACDYLYQMEEIRCNPQNVIIATPDGNGVLKQLPSQTSINTMEKVTLRVKEKWNANIVIIGIHPILLSNENLAKNPVNVGVSQFTSCYIDPLPIFGVGENDPPSPSVMLDSIHYNSTIYPLYKTQIENQCGYSF